MSILLLIYLNIGLVINTDRLKYVLDRFDIFKSYSWELGRIEWSNDGWGLKNLEIAFKDFCFDYENESVGAKGCFSKIHFKAHLSLNYPFLTYRSPLTLYSPHFEVIKKETPKESSPQVEEKSSDIDVRRYYSYLWSDYVPSLDINFKKIDAKINPQKLEFPLNITKDPQRLELVSSPFRLYAMKEGVQLVVEENTKLPLSNYNIELKKAILSLSIREEINISFFGLVEFVEVNLTSKIPSIINLEEIPKLTGILLENFKLYLLLPKIQENLSKNLPAPYNSLPAPLNEMEGDVFFRFQFSPLAAPEYLGKGELNIDLKSSHQSLNLSFFPQVKVSAEDFSYSDIFLNLVFNKVLIELPRFSKRSLPPQFVPDGRFKTSKVEPKKKQDPVLLDLKIKAEEETSLQLKTDLIEEIVKLNFNFNIKDNELVDGYLRLLPLSLKILKRPIKVERLWVNFLKGKSPALNSIIWFNLPEYKIKLILEGPMSSPRYVFSSDPPLPQSDIYSVLLFGRPLQDMGGDNTAAAQQTSSLISQGLLSLSVLYILSGTPIEYIGYDPKSKEASAQVGLGDKNSLRISSGAEGRTTGVRRSLGKGWYLDTSVQSPSGSSKSSTQRAQDYGLFLERIISY